MLMRLNSNPGQSEAQHLTRQSDIQIFVRKLNSGSIQTCRTLFHMFNNNAILRSTHRLPHSRKELSFLHCQFTRKSLARIRNAVDLFLVYRRHRQSTSFIRLISKEILQGLIQSRNRIRCRRQFNLFRKMDINLRLEDLRLQVHTLLLLVIRFRIHQHHQDTHGQTTIIRPTVKQATQRQPEHTQDRTSWS